MKTAISIPDRLFQEADDLARRLRTSRSRLYADAVAAYLESHRQGIVAEELDRIYAGEPSAVDPVVAELQARTLGTEDW